MPSLWLAI